jgi:hypothetical protein
VTTLNSQEDQRVKNAQAAVKDAPAIASHVGQSSGRRLASEKPFALREQDSRSLRRARTPARVQSAINDHKYEVAQMVNFTPDKSSLETSPGRYEILRQLPTNGSENQYRVRSVEDNHERVVRESQLA